MNSFLFGIKIKTAHGAGYRGYANPALEDSEDCHAALMLAWYFHKYEAALKALHFAVAFLLLLVPFGLIAKQPDLGTAILVGAAGFYVISFCRPAMENHHRHARCGGKRGPLCLDHAP